MHNKHFLSLLFITPCCLNYVPRTIVSVTMWIISSLIVLTFNTVFKIAVMQYNTRKVVLPVVYIKTRCSMTSSVAVALATLQVYFKIWFKLCQRMLNADIEKSNSKNPFYDVESFQPRLGIQKLWGVWPQGIQPLKTTGSLSAPVGHMKRLWRLLAVLCFRV